MPDAPIVPADPSPASSEGPSGERQMAGEAVRAGPDGRPTARDVSWAGPGGRRVARDVGWAEPGPRPGGDGRRSGGRARGRGGGPPPDDLATLARGGILNLVGAVCNALFAFVLTLVITRRLHAAGAGAFFEAVALFTILSTAAGLGADLGLVRMIARHLALDRVRDVRRSITSGLVPVLVVGAALAVFTFVNAAELARLLARSGHRDALAAYLRALAPLLPLAAAYSVSVAASRGFGTMVPAVLIDRIGRPVLQPVLVLAVLVLGAGSTLVALAWGAPIAVGLVAALVWLYALVRRAERHPRPRRAGTPPGQVVRAFWRFTGPRGLASMFQVAFIWLNTLFIGALRSTQDAGAYTAATRYLVVGSFVTTSVLQVAGPKISELFARRAHGRAALVYQTSAGWMVAAAWPIYLTLALFAPFFVKVFGSGFGPGAVVLRVIALAMLVATITGPVDIVLLMGGRSSWNLVNTLAALAANVALNFLLIPAFGLAGAALAWSASILINNLAPLAQVWMFLHLHPFGRGTLWAGLAAAVCFGGVGLAVTGFVGQTWRGFGAYAVIATGLYALLVRRWRDAVQLRALGNALRLRGRGGRGNDAEPAAS